MAYTVLIYACMCTKLLKTPIACFLFRLKNPDTKTPHTCLSQPHGGYCLRPRPPLLADGYADATHYGASLLNDFTEIPGFHLRWAIVPVTGPSTTAVHPLTPPPAPPIGPSMSDHSTTRDNCASGSRVARPATAARATVAGPRFVQ